MKRLLILSLTFLISFSSPAQHIDPAERFDPAQHFDPTRLDSLFNTLTARNLAMGSISITQNGKLIYQRTVGKDQDQTAAYRIGSITKVFTAILIYELIDSKRLSLDDTLSEFFPDLPNAGRITIAEMLGHRSGLENFAATVADFNTWKEQPQTHEQLIAYIKNQQPDFEPGKKADYNNSNFLLLGYALSGREFHNVQFGFFFEFDQDGKQLIVHDAATTYWLHKQG